MQDAPPHALPPAASCPQPPSAASCLQSPVSNLLSEFRSGRQREFPAAAVRSLLSAVPRPQPPSATSVSNLRQQPQQGTDCGGDAGCVIRKKQSAYAVIPNERSERWDPLFGSETLTSKSVATSGSSAGGAR